MFSFVLVFYGVTGLCIQTAVKRAKSEDLAPASVIECTRCDRVHYARAHGARSSACLIAREVHVTLAAIANLLALWDFRAVTRDWVHTSGLSTERSSTLPTIERTRPCARVHCLRSSTPTWLGSTLVFLINRTSGNILRLTFLKRL